MVLLQELENIINSYYGVVITEKRRLRGHIDSRYIFSKIAFDSYKCSKSEIARYLKVNHGTVISYLKNFDGVLKTDKAFVKIYESVLNDFKRLDKDLLDYKEKAKINQLEYYKRKVIELTQEIDLILSKKAV